MGTQRASPLSTTADKVTISGSPGLSVAAGQPYSFTPSASDSLGHPLTFSISNLPSWATFDATSGSLTGVPSTAQAGTYKDIVITAGDGRTSASLVAFGITVTSSASGVTVSWVAPKSNTDGSVLNDLSGFYLYYGSSADGTTQKVQIASSTQTTYSLTGLAAGNTYFFAVTAYNSSGVQSSQSTVVSATI